MTFKRKFILEVIGQNPHKSDFRPSKRLGRKKGKFFKENVSECKS